MTADLAQPCADLAELLHDVQDVRRLKLSPDETLVLRFRQRITPEEADRVKSIVQAILGFPARVLVVGDDAEVFIASEAGRDHG